jgi:hypothetical protein
VRIIAICAGLVILCGISVQAAPLSPAKAGPTAFGAAPHIELVAQGCGYGYRRTLWQDEAGYWHWGRCVPKWWGSLSRQQFTY